MKITTVLYSYDCVSKEKTFGKVNDSDVYDFVVNWKKHWKNSKDVEIGETIKNLLPDIENVCDDVLKENGYKYKSRAKINVEEFPTRVYGGMTFENGFYDALIIELGSGSGDNW